MINFRYPDIPFEEYLSNHCLDAPAAVVRRYMTKVIEWQVNSGDPPKIWVGSSNL
ncbi:hypothetical protein RhiirA1_475719 [Rhizophagus irregularis]|uniref:Uncharacterized protein n=1 Tax=Rhizophagus irregularis TaxID=588596 RepID=A0A2N0QWH5_9GLOM|nr:hypothetical protein RhiirA1_475719 [Rhizophagus irregularis]